MTKPAAKKEQQRSRFSSARDWSETVARSMHAWSKEKKKKKAWRIAFIALAALGFAAWVGVVLLISQYFLAAIFIKLLPEDALVSNSTTALYSVLVYAISLPITIFGPWLVFKKKTTRDELGLTGTPTWTDLLLSPIGFIVMMLAAGALTALMMAILPDVNWEQTQQVGFHGLYRFEDFSVAFLCLVILAPLCEEIVFRGWLYGKLRARMVAVPAILIVSVLFGVMHGQWNVGVTVFAMSVVMCIMRELTGTIWSGALVHMIKNGIAFYILFVA